MKKNILICIITTIFLCGGCTDKYLKPTSICKPLSAYDTIVIAPFDGDSSFVEELQYGHLPKEIARATTERLKDTIEDNHIFRSVIQSSDCVDHAIKIDGKIYSLTHYRRSFHVGIRGQITDCQNGERLYIFDNDDEQDSEIVKLPGQIAGKLVAGIKAKLICEKDTSIKDPALLLQQKQDKKSKGPALIIQPDK